MTLAGECIGALESHLDNRTSGESGAFKFYGCNDAGELLGERYCRGLLNKLTVSNRYDQLLRTALDSTGPLPTMPPMNGPRLHLWRTLSLLFCACVAWVVVGCSRSPEALLQTTIESSRQAEAACKAQDAEKATAAAKRATKALGQLEKLAASQRPEQAEARRVVGEARLAAQAAQAHAELADEEQQRRERLSCLKVKAYRAAREPLIRGLCAAAAFGAGQVGKQGTNGVTLGDRNLAEDAKRLALLASRLDRTAPADGDWEAIAAQFNRWGTNPPVEANLFLGLALALAGQTDLALAELDAADTNRLGTTNALVLHRGALTLLYCLKGWNRLAVREAAQFAALAPGSDFDLSGADAVVLVHLWLAGDAFTQRDWARVDREIAECVKVSPNSPIVVYLTGERLAATGDWEKAADSMEASATTAEDKWFAQRLAQRARELRDGRGSKQRLALDPKFLFEVTTHLAVTKARNSEAARKLERLHTEAGAFGKRLLEKLPL